MWVLPFLRVALSADPPPPEPPPPPPDAEDDEGEEDDGTERHPIPYAEPYVPGPPVEPPKYQPPIARPAAAPTGAPPPPATATTRYTPTLEPRDGTTPKVGANGEARSGLLGFSLEGGYAWLVGSNAAAWGPGPSARLNVDVQDAVRYRASASWGVSFHGLDDPTVIWGPAGAEATGRSQLHTIVGGGRYFLTEDASPVGFRVVPFVGGGGGLVLTVAHVEAVGQTSGTVRVRFEVEGTGGVELRVGPGAAVTLGARAALVPLFLSTTEGRVRPGGLLALTPVVAAGWTF